MTKVRICSDFFNLPFTYFYLFSGLASLATLSGTIYLIDGSNDYTEKIEPVYEVTNQGLVKNTKLYMFVKEYEENWEEISDYYDIVKTFVYMKRSFKTVQEVIQKNKE